MLDDHIGFKTRFAECTGFSGEYNDSKKALMNMLCECGNTFQTAVFNLKDDSKVTCGCRTTQGRKIPKVGDRFGKLVCVEQTPYRSMDNKLAFKFVCDCGTEKLFRVQAVLNGNTASCGCAAKERGIADVNKRYVGKKYNSLTFKQHSGKWAGPAEGKNPIAVWSCDCGGEKEVRIGDVVGGKTTCCGCGTGREVDGGRRYIGKKWNKLELIDVLGKNKYGSNKGLFRCECGKTTTGLIKSVMAGKKKSCGCTMSSLLRGARGFTLDETKFETITDESAYWLGFLLADGNVSGNAVTINLKTSDTPHLEKFRAFMCGNQTIHVMKDVRMSGYTFGSIKVAKDLAKWGIVPNKSLIAYAHDDLKMNPHFWRGVVDGDGTIYKTGIGLCGTEAVCQAFLDFAKTLIPTGVGVVKCKDKNLWHVRIATGSPDRVKLAKDMYDNGVVHLDRKYARVMTMLARVEYGRGEHVTYEGVTYKSKKDLAEALGVSFDKMLKILDGGILGNEKAVPVVVNGATYESKSEACRQLNVSLLKLNDYLNGGVLENTKKMPVTINGVTYESKSEAGRVLGVGHYGIETYLKYGKFETWSDIKQKVRFNGVVYESIKELSRKTGIAWTTLHKHVDSGEPYLIGYEYDGMLYKSVTKLAEHLKMDRKKVLGRLGDKVKVVESYLEKL